MHVPTPFRPSPWPVAFQLTQLASSLGLDINYNAIQRGCINAICDGVESFRIAGATFSFRTDTHWASITCDLDSPLGGCSITTD